MNFEVLKAIKSVCPDCRSKGYTVSENGNINFCKRCNGKGYLTYEELVNEIKELGATKRQEEEKKFKRKGRVR